MQTQGRQSKKSAVSLTPECASAIVEYPDFVIAEFTEMKTQPSLGRAFAGRKRG
jgi:hypothetical protein